MSKFISFVDMDTFINIITNSLYVDIVIIRYLNSLYKKSFRENELTNRDINC